MRKLTDFFKLVPILCNLEEISQDEHNEMNPNYVVSSIAKSTVAKNGFKTEFLFLDFIFVSVGFLY